MKLSSRKATTKDVPFIQRVNRRQLPGCGYVCSKQYIRSVLRDSLSQYRILKYNGKDVGGIAFSYSNDGKATEIDVFAIQKRYQRKGLGTFAMGLVEEHAKLHKHKRIRVASYRSLGVKAFYLKMGFKVTSRGKDMNDDDWYWNFRKRV